MEPQGEGCGFYSLAYGQQTMGWSQVRYNVSAEGTVRTLFRMQKIRAMPYQRSYQIASFGPSVGQNSSLDYLRQNRPGAFSLAHRILCIIDQHLNLEGSLTAAIEDSGTIPIRQFGLWLSQEQRIQVPEMTD